MSERSEVAAVLDAVVEFIRRYVVVSEPQAAALALWVVHGHALDAAETTPYIAITSAAKRSGKSRLLEALALLVAKPLRAAGVTQAALFRSIAERRPTLLMDEVDAIFGPKAGPNNEDLRALLNAGFQVGTPVLRCVGDGSKQKVVEFAVFCPKALAGIGKLPDTIADRSILIRLKRRARGETVARFRRREAEAAAEPLHQALASLGEHHVDRLAEARPELPEALDDRAADGWEPLFAIADLAGGDWPERSRRAAIVLAQARDDHDDSYDILILEDVKQIFLDSKVERISTADLLRALEKLEESPWADWHGKSLTARGLARLLAPHGIRSGTVRLADGTTPKGYKREDFEDAWKRYVPEKRSLSATSDTTRMDTGIEASFKTPHQLDCGVLKRGSNPHEQTVVSDVADRTSIRGNGTENGHHLIPGDSEFPDFIDGRFQDGELVESEWLERRKVHAGIVEATRLERGEL